MKTPLCKHSVLFACCALVLGGCSSTEAGKSVSDISLSGAGGVLGYQLSDGKPAATAAGAIAGYLVSKTVQSSRERALKEAQKDGYERGLNQAVKQQYWIIQNQQKSLQPQEAHDSRLLPVVIPETKIDGVTTNAHVEFLRIEP